MSGPNYHQGVSRVQEAASILRISCSVRLFYDSDFHAVPYELACHMDAVVIIIHRFRSQTAKL